MPLIPFVMSVSSLLQCLLLFRHGLLPDEASDQLTDALTEANTMSVNNIKNALAHLLAHHAARHLSDGTNRHVVDKGDVQVRLTLFNTLIEQRRHNLPDEACLQTLGVVKLSYGIISPDGAGPTAVRDVMAEQRSELRVRDGLDVCLGIGGQLCEIFTGRSICALHGNGAAEADIGCGSADQNVIFSAVNFKPVGDTVPVAEGLVIQRNGDLLALSCLQEDFGKAFQLTIRPVDTGIFCMDIQLRYLGSVDFAGVLQGKDGGPPGIPRFSPLPENRWRLSSLHTSEGSSR